MKAESCRQLGIIYKKIGKKWVLKARPYYKLLRQSQKVTLLLLFLAPVYSLQLQRYTQLTVNNTNGLLC